MNRVFSLLALLLAGAPCAESLAQSATIEQLGYLNLSEKYTVAHGVSPDGQTVVGGSLVRTHRHHVIRWTPKDKLQDLGNLTHFTEARSAAAFAVSPNGVIVGLSEVSPEEVRAFRMGPTGGMQALSTLGLYSRAHDVSDDGSVIFGYSIADYRTHAVRWTGAAPGTIVRLGTIGDVVGNSAVNECSADGTIAVGESWNGTGIRACLYRDGQPPRDLGALPEVPGAKSVANGISADGAVVVGYTRYQGTGNYRAMYWTETTGMVALDTVDGVEGSCYAEGVSGDGKLIIGRSDNDDRPGGIAAVWIDGQPRQLLDLLVTDYGADPAPWTTFDELTDVSRDGSVLVGYGTYEGRTSAFRITLRETWPPTVTPPKPISVECDGGLNTVVLSAQVNDADATDRLTVTWSVGGIARQTTSDVVPGSTVKFSFNYPDGETAVSIGVSDGKAATSATTKVTVVDTKSPIIVVAADVRGKVDRGEVFASGIELKPPFVRDVCDPAPKVTSNAKARYRIGTTKVTWTVRDKTGNVARAVQQVIVKNDPPVANAGTNVTLKTRKASVRAKLNGSLSRDPNGHKLKYLWKARGAKLTGATTARPTGIFKVGTTRVTLTVTDEAGAKSTDLMTVKVRAVRTARTAATLADASVRESQLNALDSYQRGSGDSLSSEGLSLAASALALGAMAGDEVGADDEAPVSQQELTSYLTLRAQAAQQARMAGDRFYQSFLIGGEENALAASMYAYYASGLNLSDLTSGDVHEAIGRSTK